MTGYARLVNIKGDKDYGPEPGETVVKIDREHPHLGNRHYLSNKADSKERNKVISLFEHDLDLDELANGPMTKAIHELALRVIAGEKIVLMCWCTPLACHGDVIIKRIRAKVQLLLKNAIVIE